MSQPVIEVKNITKSFKIPLEGSSGLKQKIINMIRGKKGYRNFTPLNDISFTVEEGDFYGIVGRNGSGKSTLLKTIAGIYVPNSGSVDIKGSLVPFIELGVGFNMELTGRENVYLNAALLGFDHEQTEAMYQEIVGFAELEDFMEEKLKNYSSGMQVRLAFSIAIRARGDVLLLDEVLAVGDEAFQKKCKDYFYKAKREGRTIVLVTHDMSSVRQFCNKAMLIIDGKVAKVGNPDQIASAYSDIFIKEQVEKLNKEQAAENSKNDKSLNLSDVNLESVKIIQNGKSTKVVDFRKDFTIDIVVSASQKHKGLVMGVPIIDQAGRSILSLSTKQLPEYNLAKGLNHLQYKVQNVLGEGDYYLNIAIERKKDSKLLLQKQEVANFTVIGMDKTVYSKFGLTHPDVSVKVIK